MLLESVRRIPSLNTSVAAAVVFAAAILFMFVAAFVFAAAIVFVVVVDVVTDAAEEVTGGNLLCSLL